MSITPNYQTYQDMKSTHPKLYAVDLAAKMGITELELAQIRIGFETRRLNVTANVLLSELNQCGQLKAITRNRYAVSEQLGLYENCDFSGHAGLILNPRGIDLRLFFSQWQHIFAFEEPYTDKEGHQQIRNSLQIFNDSGLAIHKIYTTPNTDIAIFNDLVKRYEAKTIQPIQIQTPVNQFNAKDTVNIDVLEFESKWRALTDVHDFYGLLKAYNLSRQMAFKLVSRDLAYQIEPTDIEPLLTEIQSKQNEVMFFVSNPGCVQIFTGQLEKVTVMHGWLNVFNQKFTLHLQHKEIDEAWVTRKPTADGIVTSLELYAKDGSQIVQMYGQRTEGKPEQSLWRKQLQMLNPLATELES